MTQMSGSYSESLLARQRTPSFDPAGLIRSSYIEPLDEFRPDANELNPRQSWFSRFAPDLRKVLVDLPTDPAAIGGLLTGGAGSSVRAAPSARQAPVPRARPEPIDEEEALSRQMAARILTGRIETGQADLTGTGDEYAAMADQILVKQARAAIADETLPEEARAQAAIHIADYEARQKAARIDAERSLSEASTDPSDLPARAVQLWSQGTPQAEIDELVGSAWTRLDPENAQKMLDRLEIEADILRDQGKLTEAAGLLQARRAIMRGSEINLDANARPYDVMLDQIARADAARGGRAGAFSAAGSDAFVSTIRGIGRLMDVYPDQRDFLERLVGASYEEHPATSFAGSFAGGMFDPVFFGLSMGISRAPVTAAARARYADDLIRAQVPVAVAQEAAERLTLEGLATHGLTRYFMNSEKAMRAKGLLSRSRAPLTETQARALASVVWNASDGAISNAMAEGIVGASEGLSPLEITLRAAEGGAMGLLLGTGLSGIFSGAASLARVLTREIPGDIQRGLDAGRDYVATGGPDAERIQRVLEGSVEALNRAMRVKGENLTPQEARDVLAEIGVDVGALQQLRREQVVAKATDDGVVDAGEMEAGAFAQTPATVIETVEQAIPDAQAGMAASLAEEATGYRAALAELAETRTRLAEAETEARTDPLTKLMNRRGLTEGAARVFARSDETGKPAAVVAFDMSNFKALNDVYGHEKGDEALEIIARVLDQELRTKPDPDQGRTEADLDEPGIVSRPGGDEFAAVLYGADQQTVWNAVNRVEAAIEYALEQAGIGHIDTTKGRRHVRLIGGVAVREAGSGVPLETLLNAADQASIARKDQWKRQMREPEGRFDLSEVERGATDVSRDPDQGNVQDGGARADVSDEGVADGGDGGGPDSEPAQGLDDGGNRPVDEAGADGDAPVRAGDLSPQVDDGRTIAQRALFPDIQGDIDAVEAIEARVQEFRGRFPELANIPDEAIAESMRMLDEAAEKWLETFDVREIRRSGGGEVTDKARLEATEEAIQELEDWSSNPEEGFGQYLADESDDSPYPEEAILEAMGTVPEALRIDVEADFRTMAGEILGPAMETMKRQLEERAKRLRAIVGRDPNLTEIGGRSVQAADERQQRMIARGLADIVVFRDPEAGGSWVLGDSTEIVTDFGYESVQAVDGTPAVFIPDKDEPGVMQALVKDKKLRVAVEETIQPVYQRPQQAAPEPDEPTIDVAEAPEAPAGDPAKASKLRALASKAAEEAENKLKSSYVTSANTARQARIGDSVRKDAERLEQIADVLNALADAAEDGTLPPILANVNTRALVEDLLTKQRHPIPLVNWRDVRDALEAAKGRKGIGNLARSLQQVAMVRDEWFYKLDSYDDVANRLEEISQLVKLSGKRVDVSDGPEWKRANKAGLDATNWTEARKAILEYAGPRKAEDPVTRLERALVGRKGLGIDFFPTPREMAGEIAEDLDIRPGMRVLEPSAGNGHLADAAKARGVTVDVAEISFDLREILKAKGHNLVADNFLDYNPGPVYDRILMNPPFSKRLDAEHVQHAYELLAPGGRMTAIVGEGVFFGGDAKAVAFREWLESVGATSEKLPEGSFTKAQGGLPTTGVAARIVKIEKAAEAVADAFDVNYAHERISILSRRVAKAGENRTAASEKALAELSAQAKGLGDRGKLTELDVVNLRQVYDDAQILEILGGKAPEPKQETPDVVEAPEARAPGAEAPAEPPREIRGPQDLPPDLAPRSPKESERMARIFYGGRTYAPDTLGEGKYLREELEFIRNAFDLAERFDERTRGLDPRTESGGRDILAAFDELSAQQETRASRFQSVEESLSGESESRYLSAKYQWDGERLLDDIDKLDPENLADAERINQAYIAHNQVKEGREPLAKVAAAQYARAMQALGRAEMIPVETLLEDMKVWAVDERSMAQVKEAIAKAQEIEAQREKGIGDFKKPKPATAKKPSAAGKVSQTKPVKTVADLQKAALKRIPVDGRQIYVAESGEATFFAGPLAARLRTQGLTGKLELDPGFYNAEGRGIVESEMAAERARDFAANMNELFDKPLAIDLGEINIDAMNQRVGKAGRIFGPEDENSLRAMVLAQNPDGSLGVAGTAFAGTAAVNVDAGATPLASFDADLLKDAMELIQLANRGERPVRLTLDAGGPMVMLKMEIVGTGDRVLLAGLKDERVGAADRLAKASSRNRTIPEQVKEETDRIRVLRGDAGRRERIDRIRGNQPAAIDRMGGGPEGSPEITPATSPGTGGRTKGGRALIGRIKADPQGLRVGPRSIRQWLADELGVVEMIRREQTSGKNPAHYNRGTHTIRSRVISPGWLLHEHGHAISNDIRVSNEGDSFLIDNGPALLVLAEAEGSMASKNSPEEGFAEFVRLYITDPARLDQLDPRGVIAGKVREAVPARMELLDDAREAWAAHMARSAEARWRSHQNDVRREGPSAKGLLRNAMVRFAQRGYAMESLTDQVLRQVNKEAESITAGWKKVAEIEKAIEGTGADPRAVYASLLHVDQTIGIALEGTKANGAGGGLRVYATQTIPGKSGETGLRGIARFQDIAELQAAGFKLSKPLVATLLGDSIEKIQGKGIPTNIAEALDIGSMPLGAKPGTMLVLSEKSVLEAIRPVEGRWAEFETYAQMKATLERFEKRSEFKDYQTQYEGVTPDDLRRMVKEAEEANPEFLTVGEDLQDIYRATLLLDLMSGERDLEETIKLAKTWDFYVPLTRIGERGSKPVNTGATTSPTSGIRRSRGSVNAAEPLLAATHRKIAESVSAYYWNRYMQAPLHFAAKLDSIEGVSEGAKRMARRVMMPLKLDTKKMVDLSESEQMGVIWRWIRDLAVYHTKLDADQRSQIGMFADWPFEAFTPDEFLSGSVTPEMIDIIVPGKKPIFRRVKPAAVNVVAPFINGERQYFQVNDPMLFEVFASDERAAGWIRAGEKIVGSLTQPWKNSITQTAVFSLRSLARDYPTAMAFGKDAKALIPGYYHTLGFLQMLTGKAPESFSQPEIMSRTFRHVSSEDFVERRSRLMRELVGELVPQGWKDANGLTKALSAPGIAVRVLLRPIELFQVVTGQRALATAAETAPRIGAFVAAKRRGLSDEAAQLAADTVTGYFAERPLSASAHSIYRMAGFLNPAVQVTTQYARILLDPVPARAAARIGAMSAAVAATTAVIWALKELLQTEEDREREFERTEDERLSHMDIRGVRIPFDYGFAGGIQSFVYNTLDTQAGGLPDVDRSQLAGKVLKQALPPHLTSPVELLPPIGRAGLEVTANYSFYRDQPLLPDYMRYLEPSEQAFSTTPELYRWFGGLIGESPAKIEHIIRNGISVTLADKIRAVDRMSKGAGVDELYEMPEIGRMFSREPMGWNSRSVESVQELDRKYQALNRRLDAMEKEPGVDPEALAAMRVDLREYEPFHRAMLDIERRYREAKKARQRGDEDRDDELQREMIERAQRAMGEALELPGE